MKEGSTIQLSLKKNYAHRHILITGSTGFVGKVLLSMLLQYLSNCERIYILIRANNHQTAKDRFIKLIEVSPAFITLRKHYGSQLKALLNDKIHIVQGDITKPHLGIDINTRTDLYKKIDLVIHIAGLVEFSPNIQLGLDINVMGTIHVADFVAACERAVFAYISTCYVAGKRNGFIPEAILSHQAPNGAFFDVENELITLKNLIQEVKAQHSDDYKKRGSLNKALKKLGHERAIFWGWTNTYTYTKAMAECILVCRYAHLRFTIIRPSIIESARAYPSIGWNEGFNTCGPYCYIAGGWYPYMIYKEKQIIDIVPVDYVCNAILVICAALLDNKQSPIYQIATSNIKPVSFKDVTYYSRIWHKRMLKETEKSWIKKYLRCFKSIKNITPHSFLSPQNLIKLTNQINHKLKKSSFYHFPIIHRGLKKISKRLKTIERALYYIHVVYSVYQPFTYDNQYDFACVGLKKIDVEEPEFKFDIEQICWKDYWLNAQMPGLNRWVFPTIRGKSQSNTINVNIVTGISPDE